ncbi:hypothetical protein Btru_064481 [Bulinus truncatus]|nr:hypothetical protein Btru_064481 [Bulinus truncatus]
MLSSASLTLFLIPLLQGMLGSLLICHPRLWLAIIIGIAGLVAVVTQSANFVQLYYLTSITHQSAIRLLKKVITEKYEVVPGNEQTAAFNLIMIMGECCGVEGPADFRSSRLSVNFTLGVNPYDKIKIPRWMDMGYSIPTPNISFQATFKVRDGDVNVEVKNQSQAMIRKKVSFISIDEKNEDVTSRTRMWLVARVVNMVMSLGYLPLIICSIWIVIKIYYYGGRTLLNSFDINDRKLSIFVPVWYHISDHLDFGDWLNVPFVLTVFMSNIWLLNFALSFDLLVWGKSTFTCLIAIIMILCTMAFEGGIFYNIHGLDSTIMFNIRIKMQSLIQKEYKVIASNDLTIAMNMMMVKGDCCGFSGPHDFRNVSLRAVLKKNVNPYTNIRYYDDSPPWLRRFTVPNENMNFDGVFKIPPACCNDNVSDVNDPTIRFHRVVECATSDSFNSKHNVQGCLGHFYEESFPIRVRLLIISLIMFVQTIQIVLIIVIMIAAPSPPPPYINAEDDEFDETEDNEPEMIFSDDVLSNQGSPQAGDDDED